MHLDVIISEQAAENINQLDKFARLSISDLHRVLLDKVEQIVNVLQPDLPIIRRESLNYVFKVFHDLWVHWLVYGRLSLLCTCVCRVY